MANNCDLANFSVQNMTRCGRDIRLLGDSADCMEEAANRIATYLRSTLLCGETGSKACALVRLFKTSSFSSLESDLQNFVRSRLENESVSPDMKCLVLLATAGEEYEWNSKGKSTGHMVIPLPNEEVIRKVPMIHNLISEMGLSISSVIRPDPGLIMCMEQKQYGVFFVPEARGCSHIPAQNEFVIPYGIRSVLGFGGQFPSGDIYVVIMFLKIPLSVETADLFKPLALDVKVALLPHADAVFGNMDATTNRASQKRKEALRSEIGALKELLETREKSVIEQSDRLYKEISTRKRVEKDLLQAKEEADEANRVVNEYITDMNSESDKAQFAPGRTLPKCSQRSLRVLLAEDNSVNRTIVRSMLEKCGHTVTVAVDGKEAISFFENEKPFDLILMDVQMPEMDGLEATAFIRKKEKSSGGHVPIIALTGQSMKEARDICMKAGMDDYISKPLRADNIFSIIERVVPSPPANATNTKSAFDTPGGDVFDLEDALSFMNKDLNILGHAVKIFIRECPVMLSDIRSAIDAGKPTALSMAAHKLKGSVANFSARHVHERALALEKLGKGGDLNGAKEGLTALEKEIDRLLIAFAPFAATN
ncbi:MAG: response regulator [Candidatus Riflebacteria bacterium]|nr:response regulator [Candidatus Riflebacteria bacterium]